MNHCFEICHYQQNVSQHYYLLDTLVIPFLVRFGAISDLFGLTMPTILGCTASSQTTNYGSTKLTWYAGHAYQKGRIRESFFKKIQDSILESKRNRKWILRFFTNQINPRSLGSWCIKGTEESTLEMDLSVPLTHHDSSDLGLIFFLRKHKILFQILSDLRIQSSLS